MKITKYLLKIFVSGVLLKTFIVFNTRFNKTMPDMVSELFVYNRGHCGFSLNRHDNAYKGKYDFH